MRVYSDIELVKSRLSALFEGERLNWNSFFEFTNKGRGEADWLCASEQNNPLSDWRGARSLVVLDLIEFLSSDSISDGFCCGNIGSVGVGV